MSLFGRLIYNFYYGPKGQKAVVRKFGGNKNYALILAAESEMRAYALNKLAIKNDFNKDGKFKINFLTGEKFIHQSLFCTYSFSRFLSKEESRNFSINYYSDGTLSNSSKAILRKRFPQINLVDIQESQNTLSTHLPKPLFPFLNKNIAAFPLFKKLVFPHLNKTGLSTFFDSDMLFIKRPVQFLNWIYQESGIKNKSFCIEDVERSYGYSDPEILKIWPIPLIHNINSGMYSLYSENMDFPFIENIIKEFEEKYGPQYYMEQLITAIILEKSGDLVIPPNSEYIVLPTPGQIKNQVGTLHHYVNESKEFYFKESWKKQVME